MGEFHHIANIEVHHKLDLVVNGIRVGTHKVDFLLTYIDGTREVREVKGFRVRDFGLRMKLFCALFPEIKYKVVK